MFVRPLDSADVVVAAATAAAVATPAAAQPKPSHLSFFSLFLLPVHCACRSFAWWVTFLPFSLSPAPFSPFPSPHIPLSTPFAALLLLIHPFSHPFLPLPIPPSFLPHFPRRCAYPHLPVFPRVFSALRCVCVAPALLCSSLPPFLPPSLIFLAGELAFFCLRFAALPCACGKLALLSPSPPLSLL